MLFNSFDYLLFFPTVVLVYLWLPHRAQNIWLLAASYWFYASWDALFLGLIGVSTLVDFSAGRFIAQHRGTRGARVALGVSVATNLGILGFFKYWNFFIESFATLVGAEPSGLLEVILPVGISFYTFQTMSYTIDVYRGRIEATDDLVNFALFVAFFPQLVAGPIERADHLLPQVAQRRVVDGARIRQGVHLIAWGLIKKCVIADNLATRVVDPIFDPASNIGGWTLLIGVYGFAFQIYCDFSGYTDIAIGCARILGFDFRTNFNLPYFADSPRDFWRRWHISLSTWLRDYLYIPLGGDRTGWVFRNLLLTMTLGGLWHGAAWTFVLWGIYHGLLLALFRAEAVHLGLWSRLSRTSRTVLTFHLVCFGWLLFRAEGLEHAWTILSAFVTEFFVTYDVDLVFTRNLLVFATPLLAIQFAQARYGRPLIHRIPVPARPFVYVLGLWLFILIGEFGDREFIYFQF